MVLRLVCLILGFVLPLQAEERPNVIVVIADQKVSVPEVWAVQSSKCKVSPGRAATMAAVLYGKAALQSGVVADNDWRRHPVASENVMGLYQAAGYKVQYLADAHLGTSLISSWGQAIVAEKLALHVDKPLCAIIQQGGCYDADYLNAMIQECDGQNVILITLDTEVLAKSPMRDQYHYPATLSVYRSKERFKVSGLQVDFQIYQLLKAILAGKQVIEIPAPEHYFFHRGNWDLGESVERYRHRGSLVISKGVALVDGIELYTATDDLEPDLTKPLDISEHQQTHSELLVAHHQWWSIAHDALANRRAFQIGANGAVRLTALDWRRSRIIHADGSSPSSKPLVFQKDLIGILHGLEDAAYRETFPAYCGSWAVNILQPGRYEVTMSQLPFDQKNDLAKLKAGRAFIKLGGHKVELAIQEGTSAVTAPIDADAGIRDLECWFTGQLPLERELGAFFVEIKRIGDKKYDLTPKVGK